MLLFIWMLSAHLLEKLDFNTSHVTVYRFFWLIHHRIQINFNTSHVTVYRSFGGFITVSRSYFNTSHVTVYRFSTLSMPPVSMDFNTSHVTVYPFFLCIYLCHSLISIHLMLLFITISERS